ncbi:MAG: hydantoinase [SAR86 cluster bacterium]|uniref:Hydantoinase n=1 Tax=SAR86 cluster bacterium TaxID=2030880 RepID=A0A2A5B322_9GAMM|nr:MAG: hydantoinase [SAR86 cluster bacterium]
MLLGIDAGGTFTDFIFVDLRQTISIRVHKTLSTPAAPEQAILQGISAMGLESYMRDGSLQIIHGSTVATNLLLEGKLARTVFVTNYGFADMLLLARQTRPALYALEFPEIEPPVAAQLCLETGGRIAADGSVVEPLSEPEIDNLVEKIKSLKPEAVAINLLFSFLDDGFEREIEAAIHRAGLPVFVSRSSQVLPEYKEYERGIATWLNASLAPAVSGYLQRLQQELGDNSLQLMQSSGETIAAHKAADSAVNLLLSGPAGGLTAIAFLGEQLGISKIISFDMGGTSTDVALLDGQIATTNEATISRYPIAVPMVDMQTIGAGGGSIAFVDSGGMLQLGPLSAGADPGPACYDKGGSEATVTDANLVLGRLQVNHALAGALYLNESAAIACIEKLADKISLSVEETALGIVTIANEHMARAIRLISVNQGNDPQDFVLASFGGAGGLHVCAIADAMQMRSAIVPIHGGVLSALGMVVARRGRQFSKTLGLEFDQINKSELEKEFAELEQHGIHQLSDEGLSPASLSTRRSADMRYKGQSYTLNIEWKSAEKASDAFRQLHKKRYGYAHNTNMELLNIRVNVMAPNRQFSLPTITDSSNCNNIHYSKVYGHDDKAKVMARTEMSVGQRVTGPAIITEYSATTFIEAGWTVELDLLGNLLLEKPDS